MAVAPAQVRAPDIIIRESIPLAATSDMPVAAAAEPPISASNDPADRQSGVPQEITAEELAAATASRRGAGPDPGPKNDKPVDAKTDGDEEGLTLPGDALIDSDDVGVATSATTQRRILEERRRGREYRAALEALVKAKIGDEAWDNAVKQSRDKLVQAERERADKAIKDARKDREELEAIRAAQAAAPKPEEKPTADPRPARDAYDDPDAYDADLEAWGIREGERKVAATQAETKAAEDRAAADAAAQAERDAREAELAQLHGEWGDRRAAAVEKYPDYAEVAEAAFEDGGPEISEAMAAAIIQDENGAEVAYFLGKNVDEASRIAKIKSPFAQMLAMGKLSERIANPPRRARPSAPITPLDTGDNRVVDVAAEPDMNSYFEKRSKELQAARRPFYPRSELH